MEKNELIKVWVDELDRRIEATINDIDAEAAVTDVLGSVYDVGFEAGKDAQKLETQLNKKPEISNTEPGAI